jgi:hypothetical protein
MSIKKKTNQSKPIMRLTAERKKAAVALLLIAVMVLMWARLLIKKNTASAQNSVLAPQTTSAEILRPRMKITYIELPRIKGRNDTLSRDVFASNKWEGAGASPNGIIKVRQKHKNANEDLKNTIETIGKELKLEAIFSGTNPQASVGGMLVLPQSKLTVKYEGEQYEFKALAINDNEVVLECKGVQVKLTMNRPNESAN